jgi:hypothetical protein
MVRDAKKYASTGGWGYALFTPQGQRFRNADAAMETQACFACHLIVKNSRNYVFSQLAALSPEMLEDMAKQVRVAMPLPFSDRAARQLPEPVRAALPKGADHVRFLEGRLRKHLFEGTLDEIRPALLREVILSAAPALLLSEDNAQYVLLAPADEADPSYHACPNGQRLYSIFSSFPVASSPSRSHPIPDGKFCDRAN